MSLVVLAALAGLALGTFQAVEGARAALRLEMFSPATGLITSAAGVLVVAVVTLAMSERHGSRTEFLALAMAPLAVFGVAWGVTVTALPMTWPVHRVAAATMSASWSGYEFVNGECYERSGSNRPWWLVAVTDQDWARLIVAPVSGSGVPGFAVGDPVRAEEAESVFPIPGQLTYKTYDLIVSELAADGSGRAASVAGSTSAASVDWTCSDWHLVRAPTDQVAPPSRLTGQGS